MPKAKVKTEKKPIEAGTSTDLGSVDNTFPTINSTTETLINQDDSGEKHDTADDAKGRHFWFVVYPSESYVKTYHPDCTYNGSSGWGTAPDDWTERLRETGLAFNVSPLHDRDVNPDNTPKKPHWHVIVSWGNSTTYRSAKALCEMLACPQPKLLRNVTGAYRYHRHLDNPEKFQYGETSTSFNGWTVPLDSNEVSRIKKELKELVFVEDIQEYAELLIVCDAKGEEYFDVACNNTFYCERLVASYRHNPTRVLMRYYNELPDGELKNEIASRIGRLSKHESND